ncbi:MAG TPA: hypothetical protein VGK49_04310, partial [Ilumatobacteraceae bacterium]
VVAGLNLVPAPSIDVRVDDNDVIAGRADVPSVLVYETDGSTDVTEWTGTGAPGWTSDSYFIVLSRAPAAGKTVTVRSITVPTRTTRGELVYVQLQLVLADGTETSVTFDETNWWDAVEVLVVARDDADVDGSDTQAFAHRFETVTGVRGPLFVDGAGGRGSLELPPVVMLPHETNQRPVDGTIVPGSVAGNTIRIDGITLDENIDYVGRTLELLDADPSALFRRIVSYTENEDGTVTFTLNAAFGPKVFAAGVRGVAITRESANFFVVENEQIDSMTVLHTDAVRDDESVLTATRLTGLGMGPDRTIGGRRQPSGITYVGLEELDIRLGHGSDTMTIDSTHAGLTRIDTGSGDDTVYVRTTNGHTTILGGLDDDLVVVRSERALFGEDLVDFIRGLVTFDGGLGDDHLVIDDHAEASDNQAVVTKHTVSGLDMKTVNEVQNIVVRASGGSFRLRYGTGADNTTDPIAYDATAAQVQAALEAIEAIGVGNVHVTKIGVAGSGVGSIYVVRFRGALTGTDASQIGIENLDLVAPILGNGNTVTPGSTVTSNTGTRHHGTQNEPTNEIQVLEIDSSGLFTIITSRTVGDITTDYFSALLNAATIDALGIEQALLGLGLFSAGDVRVTLLETGADGKRFAIEFRGAFARTDVAQLRTGGSALTYVWTLVEGTNDAVVNDVMTVTVRGTGSFVLSLRTGTGALFGSTRAT